MAKVRAKVGLLVALFQQQLRKGLDDAGRRRPLGEQEREGPANVQLGAVDFYQLARGQFLFHPEPEHVADAKAAFFPAISLTGNAGYSSFHAGTLLDWESRLFQIGPGVALPVLNGGRLKAGLKEARANYESECANYRQQVLAAFKEVTDALNDLGAYASESASEAEAVTHAARASSSSKERYTQGLIPYVEVLDSERTQLQTELQATQILGLRLISTVHLIKALGGGFQSN